MSQIASTLPLLATTALAEPLAWRAGKAISAGQFIAEATALAATLPDGRPVNLCHDRYLFALGLAAALLRGQTSLMPPNALPDTLRQIPAAGGTPWARIQARAMSRDSSWHESAMAYAALYAEAIAALRQRQA